MIGKKKRIYIFRQNKRKFEFYALPLPILAGKYAHFPETILWHEKGIKLLFWRSGRKEITKFPKTICAFELIGEQKYPRLSAGRLPHQIASDFDDFCAILKLSVSAFWKPKFYQNPLRSCRVNKIVQ